MSAFVDALKNMAAPWLYEIEAAVVCTLFQDFGWPSPVAEAICSYALIESEHSKLYPVWFKSLRYDDQVTLMKLAKDAAIEASRLSLQKIFGWTAEDFSLSKFMENHQLSTSTTEVRDIIPVWDTHSGAWRKTLASAINPLEDEDVHLAHKNDQISYGIGLFAAGIPVDVQNYICQLDWDFIMQQHQMKPETLMEIFFDSYHFRNASEHTIALILDYTKDPIEGYFYTHDAVFFAYFTPTMFVGILGSHPVQQTTFDLPDRRGCFIGQKSEDGSRVIIRQFCDVGRDRRGKEAFFTGRIAGSCNIISRFVWCYFPGEVIRHPKTTKPMVFRRITDQEIVIAKRVLKVDVSTTNAKEILQGSEWNSFDDFFQNSTMRDFIKSKLLDLRSSFEAEMRMPLNPAEKWNRRAEKFETQWKLSNIKIWLRYFESKSSGFEPAQYHVSPATRSSDRLVSYGHVSPARYLSHWESDFSNWMLYDIYE